MKNKTLIYLIIAILVVVGFIIFLNYPFIYSPEKIVLSEDKLITNSTFINQIVNERISPNGNSLEKIIIDEDNPEMTDESWRFAYFVCNEEESIGWVYDYNGKTEKTGLYGPYGWCLI